MTNDLSVHAFPESLDGGRRLAAVLGLPCHAIGVHRFPDGETLVTAPQPASTAIVYRPLHDPNTKLVELLLAASALRDQGAGRLILVAPYLSYMRQDAAFAAGQAVSQRVIGRILSAAFDALIVAAPHLHRASDLSAVFGGKPAIAIDPAPAFATLLRSEGTASDYVILGPDQESAPLIAAVAAATGFPSAVAMKRRRNDTAVDLVIPDGCDIAGRHAVIVDDMIATGGTLIAAIRAARERGAASVEALVCHALPSARVGALTASGLSRLRSTDSVPHPSNAITLAPLLAEAVRKLSAA
jgi:ribose-phosphate pyrophosphokinase